MLFISVYRRPLVGEGHHILRSSYSPHILAGDVPGKAVIDLADPKINL